MRKRILLLSMSAALVASSGAIAQTKGYRPYSPPSYGVPYYSAPTYKAPRYTAPLPAYGTGSNPSTVFVAPTIRRDGTFVQGHARSAPNSTQLDNWSTKGNFNPYTGQPGTRNPWR